MLLHLQPLLGAHVKEHVVAVKASLISSLEGINDVDRLVVRK